MLGEEIYTLDIRPTFIDELDAAVRYIERTFRNYQAADDLVAKAYAAIDERLFAPESFEPCYREPDVRQPYYRIPDGSPLVQVFQKYPSVVVSQHRTKSNVNNAPCGGKRKESMNHEETDKGNSRLIPRVREWKVPWRLDGCWLACLVCVNLRRGE